MPKDFQPLQPPPNWTDDSLSNFIEDVYRNEIATFANKPGEYAYLRKIDDCFMTVAKQWINPNNPLTALLFLRCHAAYRTASGLAMASQSPETCVMLRSCLENAGYALHIDKHSGYGEAWLRRHDNDAAMKNMKRKFQMREVQETISAANKHAGRRFDILYQRTIDFGAHPNERGLVSSLKIEEAPDRKTFQQLYLQGDGLLLRHALRTTAQVGLCCLEVFQCSYNALFELLGVNAEMLELRKGL